MDENRAFPWSTPSWLAAPDLCRESEPFSRELSDECRTAVVVNLWFGARRTEAHQLANHPVQSLHKGTNSPLYLGLVGL